MNVKLGSMMTLDLNEWKNADLGQWEDTPVVEVAETKVLQPSTEYHAHSATGSTLLKNIHLGTLQHALSEVYEVTRPMVKGAALHCALLEPERFKTDYIFAPKVDRRTKEGKELYAYFLEQTIGKTLLTEDEEIEVTGMVKAILAHPEAMKMLTGGESEYSYFTKDETGIELKCRPDYHNPRARALIDVKSTSDASTESFCREIGNRAYHVQAAHYLDVFNASEGTTYDDFFFIAVENKAPFAVQIFHLSGEEIGAGLEARNAALDKYASFIKSGVDAKDTEKLRAFGYSQSIQRVKIPAYILNKAGA